MNIGDPVEQPEIEIIPASEPVPERLPDPVPEPEPLPDPTPTVPDPEHVPA